MTQTKQLPRGWKEDKLINVAEKEKHAIVDGPFGSQMKVHEFVSKGIPLIEMQNLKGDKFKDNFRRFITKEKFQEVKRSMIKPKDIIISKTGTLGLVAITPKNIPKAIITSRLAKFSFDENKISIDYAYYYLIYLRDIGYWQRISKGTTMKILTTTNLKSTKITYPKSLPLQKQIVSAIETQFTRLDKAIKSLKAVRQKIEVYRKAVLKKAFEKKEGWEEKELDGVCEKITDGSHYTPMYVGSGYPFLSIKNRKNGKLDFEKVNKISLEDFDRLKKNDCNPKKGDVLFSKDGTVGEVMKIDYDKEFIVLSSWAILRPSKKISQNYLYWLLKSPNVLYQSINLKSGTAIRRIILRNLKTVKISFPPSLPAQQKIVSQIESKFSVIEKVEQIVNQSLLKTEMLKKSILKSAFEGKLVK